jgi:hypothetical protein
MNNYDEAIQQLRIVAERTSSNPIKYEDDIYRALDKSFKFKFTKKRLWTLKRKYMCSVSCSFGYTNQVHDAIVDPEKLTLTLSQITNKSQIKYTKLALYIEMLLYLLNVMKTNSFVTQYENLIKEVKENAN